MDNEIDHLKTYREVEQASLSTDHILFEGLDMVRAHQRGEKVGKRERRRSVINAEKRKAIAKAEGLHREIAVQFEVCQSIVQRIKAVSTDK